MRAICVFYAFEALLRKPLSSFQSVDPRCVLLLQNVNSVLEHAAPEATLPPFPCKIDSSDSFSSLCDKYKIFLNTEYVFSSDSDVHISLYRCSHLSIYLLYLSSSWISACGCRRPCTDLPVDGGGRKQLFSIGITHLSISLSTLCLVICLPVSVYWLSVHLIHLLLSFLKCKLMPTADLVFVCKVVSLTYITSQYNHIYSPLLCLFRTERAASQLLTSQVSQRPQQASVVMCKPPQPGFLARKVNSLTAQPMKRRRLTADTWWRETASRSSSSSAGLLRARSRDVTENLYTELRHLQVRGTPAEEAGEMMCFRSVTQRGSSVSVDSNVSWFMPFFTAQCAFISKALWGLWCHCRSFKMPWTLLLNCIFFWL